VVGVTVVVVVAQAFKGTLTVSQVGDALVAGARGAGAVPRLVKGSDGGDGLLEALGIRRTAHRASGPLGEPVTADIGWLEDGTAVVESRLACGLALVSPSRRDPLVTTTRGVGELIRDAISGGAARVLVGLGGSATMDGGLGMARAWGWRALDGAGRDLPEGGGALAALDRLVPGALPAPVPLTAVADVRNRLLGPNGAAVYAPQKGADADAAGRLMAGLSRLVEVAADWDGPALAEREGAGAAGGLGFGLLCFGRAELMGGAAWVLERNDLRGALDGASLVLVAEAGFDATSLAGKLTGEAIRQARQRDIPVAVVTPSASVAPADVQVTSAPGQWSAADLTRHAQRAVRAALSLPPR
jgi:glycerate kinase